MSAGGWGLGLGVGGGGGMNATSANVAAGPAVQK